MIRVTKDALRKIIHESWKQRLANFLFSRFAHQLKKSPTELIIQRRQNRLNGGEKTKDKQSLPADDLIFARNYAPGSKWRPASVVMSTRPVSYKVKSTNDQSWNQQLHQLRGRFTLENLEADLPKKQQSNIFDVQ
ncbi:hypothetical protein T11_5056 [Trichinella zimbabwensis]|uniref:Uncharacterized protein n=1 Tax=Trichinella zimbabwensis TaxID=268475 RepID=A0A0V1HWY1_9BILA|nr:hypothetical protein T11_5056 [Trichinella zimbabwensis]